MKSQYQLTSIVISHDLSSALYFADYIAFMHQGKILFFGTAQEFKEEPHPIIQQFLKAEFRFQQNQ
jgi:phospholipid/cholesterol/gamma-HCH transport system ATP-binding protein